MDKVLPHPVMLVFVQLNRNKPFEMGLRDSSQRKLVVGQIFHKRQFFIIVGTKNVGVSI
jgi:hypothetical protein